MRIVTYSLAILFALSLAACANSAANRQVATDKASTDNTPTMKPDNSTTTWEVLEQGDQCAVTSASQAIIKSAAELDKVWATTFEGYIPAPAKPKVDFGQAYVIAAFYGEKNSGGHAVDIASVSAQTITIKHTKPGEGCMSASVITYPYIFAAVPHSVGSAEFKVVEEAVPCE